MQIIKMDKSIQDLNKIEASFCNCSKPNVVSQMDACILQQKLAHAYSRPAAQLALRLCNVIKIYA